MPRKRAQSSAAAEACGRGLVEAGGSAAKRGVKGPVRLVVRDERLTELALEGAAVGHG